ncbi:hypothetical protein, partial [Neisseria zoodegmatis]|uniref:hypothetical protein n=1 Tax=Neisseria zoodegmatis TaxID=326523 RepID=UPI001B80A364
MRRTQNESPYNAVGGALVKLGAEKAETLYGSQRWRGKTCNHSLELVGEDSEIKAAYLGSSYSYNQSTQSR